MGWNADLLGNQLAWESTIGSLLSGLMPYFFLNLFATCNFTAVIIIFPPVLPPHIFLDGVKWKWKEEGKMR